MLILNRKVGESLVIDDKIKIMILSSKGNQIRVGVEAPKKVEVYREELWDKIFENRKEKKLKIKMTIS